MRLSLVSVLLCVSAVSAVPQKKPPPTGPPKPPGPPKPNPNGPPGPKGFPPLPLSEFKSITQPLTLEQIEAAVVVNETQNAEPASFGIMATCANPRTRIEWDSYSNSDRQAFIDAIRCLQNRAPSGSFSPSRSRYEDLVVLHQRLTPNIHGNSKFLIWHRYYLWVFEDLLRTECGFNRAMPWWDEARYAGRFSQSSVFSSQWFGGLSFGGGCVNNGQFANLNLNIGPGTGNRPHCLQRAVNEGDTANTHAAGIDACNRNTGYNNMASCAETGAHAWGHNGIGGVMRDMFASPGDPVFFLHHSFVDRNFRIWQNANIARTQNIDPPLTMDTGVNVLGIRPDVRIREIMNTMDQKLCYRYSY